jgi:hypothetical protein
MKQYKTPKLPGRKTARMMTAERASLSYQTTAAFSILGLVIWNKKWAHHSDAGTSLYDPFSILVRQKERKISLALRASAGYEKLTLDTERNTTSIAASAQVIQIAHPAANDRSTQKFSVAVQEEKKTS